LNRISFAISIIISRGLSATCARRPIGIWRSATIEDGLGLGDGLLDGGSRRDVGNYIGKSCVDGGFADNCSDLGRSLLGGLAIAPVGNRGKGCIDDSGVGYSGNYSLC
jgi:hypothetical protein